MSSNEIAGSSAKSPVFGLSDPIDQSKYAIGKPQANADSNNWMAEKRTSRGQQ